MDTTNRANVFIAAVLILIGLFFLAINLFPNIGLRETWPVIFFVLGAIFFLPAIVFPTARQGLAGMFIPGVILAVLGVIFLYNTMSRDWDSWAYAWTLIPGGVGLGLALAAWYGGWGRGTTWVGIWMLMISVAVFAVFAAIFGGPALQIAGPVLLILVGILFLTRAIRRS